MFFTVLQELKDLLSKQPTVNTFVEWLDSVLEHKVKFYGYFANSIKSSVINKFPFNVRKKNSFDVNEQTYCESYFPEGNQAKQAERTINEEAIP